MTYLYTSARLALNSLDALSAWPDDQFHFVLWHLHFQVWGFLLVLLCLQACCAGHFLSGFQRLKYSLLLLQLPLPCLHPDALMGMWILQLGRH
jgi:hypothetical protein